MSVNQTEPGKCSRHRKEDMRVFGWQQAQCHQETARWSELKKIVFFMVSPGSQIINQVVKDKGREFIVFWLSIEILFQSPS